MNPNKGKKIIDGPNKGKKIIDGPNNGKGTIVENAKQVAFQHIEEIPAWTKTIALQHAGNLLLF